MEHISKIIGRVIDNLKLRYYESKIDPEKFDKPLSLKIDKLMEGDDGGEDSTLR